MKAAANQWYAFGCFITLMLNGKDNSDRQRAWMWLDIARKKTETKKPSGAVLSAFGLGRIDMAIALSKKRHKGALHA